MKNIRPVLKLAFILVLCPYDVDAAAVQKQDNHLQAAFYNRMLGRYESECLLLDKVGGPLPGAPAITLNENGIVASGKIKFNIYNSTERWMVVVNHDDATTSLIASDSDPKNDLTFTLVFKGDKNTAASLTQKDSSVTVCEGNPKSINFDLWTIMAGLLSSQTTLLNCVDASLSTKFQSVFTFTPSSIMLKNHQINSTTQKSGETLGYDSGILTYTLAYPGDHDTLLINLDSNKKIQSVHWQLPDQSLLSCEPVHL